MESHAVDGRDLGFFALLLVLLEVVVDDYLELRSIEPVIRLIADFTARTRSTDESEKTILALAIRLASNLVERVLEPLENTLNERQ